MRPARKANFRPNALRLPIGRRRSAFRLTTVDFEGKKLGIVRFFESIDLISDCTYIVEFAYIARRTC